MYIHLSIYYIHNSQFVYGVVNHLSQPTGAAACFPRPCNSLPFYSDVDGG